MQVSDHVRQVVNSIADRIRVTTYEASAYRTQRDRVEGNFQDGNYSEYSAYHQEQQQNPQSSNSPSNYHQYWNEAYDNNNNNGANPHHLLQLQNQQQHQQDASSHFYLNHNNNNVPPNSPSSIGRNNTNNQQQQELLFQSPTRLSAAQTKLNSNRKDIVDFAMKRVASVPASTRVAHDKKEKQASVYSELYGRNSDKLTYQMAQQTLRNVVQTSLQFGGGGGGAGAINNSELPPRSPVPAQQQQQQQQETGDGENLEGTQRPSDVMFSTQNQNNNNNSNYYHPHQQRQTHQTTLITSPSSYSPSSRSKTKHFVTDGTVSSYTHHKLSARDVNPALYSTRTSSTSKMQRARSSSTQQQQQSGRDILNQRRVDDMLFGVHNHKVNRPGSSNVGASSYVRPANGRFSEQPPRIANSFVMNNNNNNDNSSNKAHQQQQAASSSATRERSPESAYGLRTEAPTATSTKIFADYSSSDYEKQKVAPLGQQSAIKNTRNVSGFVEYNPEYEQFRNNLQTSLRSASKTTKFLNEDNNEAEDDNNDCY